MHQGTWRHLVVAIAGFSTFIATVVVIAVIERATGFNLFGLSVWLVIPVGAILTGFAAASGYYIASFWLHVRPNLMLFVQMIVVAAFAQVADYYVEYSMFML